MAEDFSMWGPAESGTRLAEQDQIKNRAADLDAQEKLLTIAGQPDVNRLHAAQAGKAEFELSNHRKMQEMLARQATGEVIKTTDLAGRMEEIASMSLGAGLITQGEQAAKTAGYLRGKSAQIDNWNTSQRVNQLKADKERMESIAALAGDVKDQASWDRANMLFQFNHGIASPYAGMPYSPALVDSLRAGAVGTAKQIELQLRGEENASKERSRASAESLRAARESDLEERQRLARAREDRLAKNGGGTAKTTPTEDIRQATRLIAKDFPKLDSTAEAASTIASEAQLLLRRNPALDRAQAVQQAYNAAKLRGDFQETQDDGVMGTGMMKSDKQTFNSGGRSPDNPIAMPANGKGMVAGKYYMNRSGQVGLMQENGKIKVVVGRAEPLRKDLALPPTNKELGDEPEDDEEED